VLFRSVMMAEHPNVARIRRGYEIRGTSTDFSEADWEEIKDLFAEGLVYHGQGTSKFAQDFVGRDEFLKVEREFAKRGTMRQDVREIYADDVQAIVTVTVHAQNGDTTASWREAEVFRFGPDGRVTDTWGVPEDQEVSTTSGRRSPSRKRPSCRVSCDAEPAVTSSAGKIRRGTDVLSLTGQKTKEAVHG